MFSKYVIIFCPKSWVNSIKKISILQLCKINIFCLGGLVLQLDDRQTLFQCPFCPETKKGKFSNFDQSHGLINPFVKLSVWRLFKIQIFSLRGLFFYFIDHQTIFQGLLSPETERTFPFFFFYQNHVLTPLK